jgi:hypothetical protein
MKLLDLRKLAIKKQHSIRFQMKNGMGCVVNEHGVALVPGLNRIPDFNLEQELEGADSFVLEPVELNLKNPKNPVKPRTVTREELASMVGTGPAGAAHHDDHDDE